MHDKLWEGMTNLQFYVSKIAFLTFELMPALVVLNLPVVISLEPLWVLLKRQHAQGLLQIFQKSLGD